MKMSKIILGLFILTVVGLFIPQTGFAQTEKLGVVNYAAPKDWAKTPKNNIVSFTDVKQSTGHFCIITLYGATPGTGNPKSDFTREWKNLVAEPFNGEANPETETSSEDGWTVTAGGSLIEFQGNKSMAFLTVYSGFEQTVSILGVFNDPSYLPQLTAFISSVNIEKSAPVTNQGGQSNPVTDQGGQSNQPIEVYNYGRLALSPPSRQLTLADLAGNWGENSGMNKIYVYKSSGAYARSDSLHSTQEMTIASDGGYFNDFASLQNNTSIKEKATGIISINGTVLTLRQKDTTYFIIRGWLETPDMTIMVICQVAEEQIQEFLRVSDAGHNATWVRKK